MTVKELKEILSILPDDARIMFEYDGPYSHTYRIIPVGGFIIADDNSNILLVEDVEND